MPGLIGDLLNNSKSLAAQSQGISLAGKNLANANNASYARQRLVLGDLGTVNTAIGAQSMGVQAIGIQQIRDKYLDLQMTREISQTALLQSQDGNLLKAQADLGEQVNNAASSSSIGDTTTSTNGISAALGKFFSDFDSLSANPADPGAKQVLLQQAEILTNKFNTTDNRLGSLQNDITAQTNDGITTVNGLLSDIASLNGQIQTFENGAPNSAVDLRDQRQAKLEQLAQYMDFTSQEIPGSNGQIQVAARGADGTNVTLVDKGNVVGSISLSGSQFSSGVPPKALDLQGGSLKGGVLVRDGTIQQLRDDIKTTAQQLVASVNKAYNPTGTGQNFFSASAPSSGIIALDPSLNFNTLKTTATGDASGNELALAVAGVVDQTHSISDGDLINGTISGFYSQIASGFGQSVSGVESKLQDQQTVQGLVQSQRDSVSGVSQDEELTDLMKYQRGFQASARVINVIDNLLDVVINGMGR